MTAVEWLIEELRGAHVKGDFIFNGVITSELIEQAKEMEKEQLNDACYDGYYQEVMYDTRAYYDNKYKQQYKKNSQTN
jgi:hypothetical protein